MEINILAVEYPGYGIYKGKSNSTQIEKDSLAVFDYLTKVLNVKQSSIIVMGRSIGSGPACYLAAMRDPLALLLVSGFKSIK
jgi:abhydrolase domain-containing protein 17